MAEEALRQAADAIIREARERKASDIHISEGMPKNLKKDLMQIFPFRLPMDIARG